ncbi:MAG: T9SS type A sorting domain-containing protein, partial [Bacteroidetes bacterium]|nr:T9SS type A sorting domain-containing protein [Bacteroidota bacterium]
VSFSFAQGKGKEKKSELKIKIQKEENGRKTKIDTTITSDQLPALKEYLKNLDIDFDADMKGIGFEDGDFNANGNMTMHFKHPEMSKEERLAFEMEMKNLKEELNGIGDEMKDMHIEMYGFNDKDPENFDLQLSIPGFPAPPAPPAPPSPNNSFFYFGDDDEANEADCEKGKSFQFRFHSMNDEVPDSLNDEEHIVVYGAKDEETPVLEKEITTKDGDKIFIYKRKLPKKEEAKATASMPVTKIKVYPNPGNGKLSVSFTAQSKGDIQISISDANGNEVYTRTLKDFSGEYFNQVDISEKGKGTYFLKITQGDDSITKKLVVE